LLPFAFLASPVGTIFELQADGVAIPLVRALAQTCEPEPVTQVWNGIAENAL
jgi:hypothetical protein